MKKTPVSAACLVAGYPSSSCSTQRTLEDISPSSYSSLSLRAWNCSSDRNVENDVSLANGGSTSPESLTLRDPEFFNSHVSSPCLIPEGHGLGQSDNVMFPQVTNSAQPENQTVFPLWDKKKRPDGSSSLHERMTSPSGWEGDKNRSG